MGIYYRAAIAARGSEGGPLKQYTIMHFDQPTLWGYYMWPIILLFAIYLFGAIQWFCVSVHSFIVYDRFILRQEHTPRLTHTTCSLV